MKTKCRNCGSEFSVDEEYVGFTVACPSCGMETIVTTAADVARMRRNEVVNKRMANAQFGKAETTNTTLCFFLGLMFNLVGLVIAAVIGKQKGALAALWGMLVNDAIVFGFCLGFGS